MRRPFTIGVVFAAALFASAQVGAANEVYKWTDAKGLVHYTDSPPEGQAYEKLRIGRSAERIPEPEPLAAAEDPAAPRPPPPPRTSNCEIARKNLDTFETNQNIAMDRDGDGTPEPLDAEQRAVELERNRELVKLYCID
jgi:hypothetical protein